MDLADGLIVVAVFPGFDHVLSHGLEGAVERVRELVRVLGRDARVCGSLNDGAWAVFGPGDTGWDVALAAAGMRAGLGLDAGALVSFEGGPPVGAAAWAATMLARRARVGEVLVPVDLLANRAPPRGVGSFRAPDPIWLPGRAVDVLRDYR